MIQARPANPAFPADAASGRRAFTLVELMVSIALVLILIYGVNQVFKLTGDTIGATNSLSNAIRMNRSIQQSMFDDLRHAVLPGAGANRGGPFFIIRSERVSAFSNAADEQADRDYSKADTAAEADDHIRSVDSNADNTESLAESAERVALYGRSHRVDQIGFFARDLYRRQTGDNGVYASNMTSSEAWVWYGHIKQPNATSDPNSTDYLENSRNPGWNPIGTSSTPETSETNPNNFYARQWYLGRVANLMVSPQPDPAFGSGQYVFRYDAYGNKIGTETYFGVDASDLARKPLQPLGQQTRSTSNGTTFFNPHIQWSSYDLVGTSIPAFSTILKNAIISSFGSPNSQEARWYEQEFGLVYRFAGYPYPTKPMSPIGAARTVPCFVPACTQFAVEYAGDFITQIRDVDGDGVVEPSDMIHTDYGKAIAPMPDGVIDFIANGGVVKTRWYGFPRNVDTSDDTSRIVILGQASGGNINVMKDVVPLRDVLLAINSSLPPAPFERRVNEDLPNKADYGTATGVAVGARYVCAWGPSGSYSPAGDPAVDPPLPKMIRLIAGVDDPDGRITDTQIYEYVVELP